MRGGDEMGGFGGESRGLEEQEEIRWLFFIILLPEAAAARLTVGLTASSTSFIHSRTTRTRSDSFTKYPVEECTVFLSLIISIIYLYIL